MKRHESISPLSRDHHFGLLFCWKLRQGIKKQIPAERIQSYVKYFWRNHLQEHFEEEEKLLFDALRDGLCSQATGEHQQIRQLIATISGAAPVDAHKINALADALDRHIRFEERILFPHIEQTLPGETLAKIGSRLSQSHETPAKDNYSDEFWT